MELFKQRSVFSYEVFPPRTSTPLSTIYDTLDVLSTMDPDYISVTCGAGASRVNECHGGTINIAASIVRDYGVPTIAHMTCIGQTKESIDAQLEKLRKLNVHSVLALRGDVPPGGMPAGDFEHASDLIAYIRRQSDFTIAAACYPEGHPESASLYTDIENIKRKVDAGADYLITQMFFDNTLFYRFVERCLLAGIKVPIQAGIMPVTRKGQINRILKLSGGANLPQKFQTMFERYADHPMAMRDAGIAYAVDQIVDLLTQHADGVHLYTMNSAYVARRIHQSIASLLDVR